MKSFSQFCEDANLSDLARKYAQSAEGKQEARKSSRHRSESESARRRELAKSLTRRHRRKMLTKQNQAPVKSSKSRKNTEAVQKAEARGRAIRKTVTKLGKTTFKGIKKRIDNSQSGT
jgi:ParB-like chromosome segregation protein Spo0J